MLFEISLSNTNPEVMKFYVTWLEKSFRVSRSEMKVRLQLYMDMDVEKEIGFWSSTLSLSKENFRKPYIKKTTLRGLTFKGIGHGTCNVIVSGKDYYEKVMMSIKAIVDHNA